MLPWDKRFNLELNPCAVEALKIMGAMLIQGLNDNRFALAQNAQSTPEPPTDRDTTTR